MNGYSKIKEEANDKPRSVDFSDSFSPDNKKPTSDCSPKEPASIQEVKKIQETSDNKACENEKNQDPVVEQEEGHEVGKLGDKISVKLSRNASVSATSSSFHSSLKRAFSMRRSSSVSERYCRIHDQCVVLPSSIEDDEIEGSLETLQRSKSTKKKKQNRKNKFLNACKRLLGL